MGSLHFSMLGCLTIAASLLGNYAEAAPKLVSCFSPAESKYFQYNIDHTLKNGSIPLMIYNDTQEVIGFVGFSQGQVRGGSAEKRNYFTGVYLCTQGYEVLTEFYYENEGAELLENWVKDEPTHFSFSQDEGMIELTLQKVSKEEDAIVSLATFKIYDVMSDEDSWTDADRANSDFIQDWGLPKGHGSFTIAIPETLLE